MPDEIPDLTIRRFLATSAAFLKAKHAARK